MRKITRQFTDKIADVMKTGEEKISNVKTVKMFGKEVFELNLFNEKLEKALDIGYRETKARGMQVYKSLQTVLISNIHFFSTFLRHDWIVWQHHNCQCFVLRWHNGGQQ